LTLLRNRKLLTKLSLLLALLLVVILIMTGCSTRGMSPVGWSGVMVSDDNMAFTGSREGRLVAVNMNDSLKVPSSGSSCSSSSTSALGCGGAVPVVAIYGTPALAENIPIGLDSAGNQVLGKVAIFAGYNGSVYAYQSNALANLVWQYTVPVSKNSAIVSAVTVYKGLVYFGSSDGKLYALNVVGDLASRTTKLAWTFQTGDYIWATPVVSNDIVVVGSFDKKIYGINAQTGQKIWEHTNGANNIAAPLIADGKVFVGSLDSTFYALNLADGKELWTFKGKSWFWTQAVMANGVIFAPCLDNKVYALNPQSGDKIAEYDLGGQISSAPVVVNGKVVVATQNKTMWTIDSANIAAAAIKVADIPSDVSSPLTAKGDVVYLNAVDISKKNLNAIFSYNIATKAIPAPISLNY
jgi:outer membrane protein assembly factor BamB